MRIDKKVEAVVGYGTNTGVLFPKMVADFLGEHRGHHVEASENFERAELGFRCWDCQEVGGLRPS